MLKTIILLAVIVLSLSALSQEQKGKNNYEVTAGFGMLIYQSAYNMQDALGIEAALRSTMVGPLDWQAGVRIGLGPVLPEVFGRVLLQQETGAWRPEIGLELGVTGRAKFEDGAFLLRETREAMQTDINSLYMAIHTAPLSFKIKKKWKLSLLEIDFGTHFTHFGRTLRAQVTVVSAGRKF
jgi:hypothetical protein